MKLSGRIPATLLAGIPWGHRLRAQSLPRQLLGQPAPCQASGPPVLLDLNQNVLISIYKDAHKTPHQSPSSKRLLASGGRYRRARLRPARARLWRGHGGGVPGVIPGEEPSDARGQGLRWHGCLRGGAASRPRPRNRQEARLCPIPMLHSRSRPGALALELRAGAEGQGGGWERVRQLGRQLGLSPTLLRGWQLMAERMSQDDPEEGTLREGASRP